MPRRDSRDHALLLLSKAKADKLVLDKLADDSEIADLLKAHDGSLPPRARQLDEQRVDSVLGWADAELTG